MIHKNVEQEIEQKQLQLEINSQPFNSSFVYFSAWTFLIRNAQERLIHEVVIVINDSLKVLTRFCWIQNSPKWIFLSRLLALLESVCNASCICLHRKTKILNMFNDIFSRFILYTNTKYFDCVSSVEGQ